MSDTMTETELSSPTSTSSSDDFSPSKTDKINYKKSNKPMMEKKRRARINCCLNQLKSLVLQAMKKDNSQYSKLEKADILELTVRHLKNVQRYPSSAMTNLPDAMSKYRAGFNECASEVVRYLAESQAVNDEARTRILSHLASLLSPINNIPLPQNQVPILPAQLQQVQHHLQQQQQQQPYLQPQQQQQPPYLQQLYLQQTQNAMFASSSQSLAIDANNNKSSVLHPAFLAPAGSNVDISHMISGSLTAFQSPIISAGNPNLQFPYATTEAAAATTTHLQLVPTTLPSGQVALVLAPQNMPVFGSGTETPSLQNVSGSSLEDHKPQVAVSDSSIPLGKKRSESHGGHDITSSASRQLASMASLQALSMNLKHIDTPTPSSASNTSGLISRGYNSINTNTFSSNIVRSNSNTYSSNVVRTTATWRPW